MDKIIQINFRKLFKISKEGDMIDAIVTFRNTPHQEWYEGYSQDKRQLRIDLWLVVFYISWWGKRKPLN